MHLFILGLGYSSLAIARLAMEKGLSVSGTTRNPEKASLLEKQGIRAMASFDPHSMDWGRFTHILSSIPPQDGYVEPEAVLNQSCWRGYLSTTGVYGDWQGAWVDEASELRPNSKRLERRVLAEAQWQAKGGHIFRLAGIYGPGRSAIDDVRAGTARRIDKPQQVFSRIHVDDIAQTIVASMHQPDPASVYNICDDEPAPAHEVVAYASDLLGVAPPALIPYEQAELSPMAREFYASNRRVKNGKIKRALGVVLRYPTYREGLAQCLQRLSAE